MIQPGALRRSDALLALLLLSAPGRSSADEPSTAAVAEARSDRGHRLYRNGQFEPALAEYVAAYETGLDAVHFLDIAKCHRRLGRLEPAIYFYQGYLAWKPDGPARGEVERELAELQAAVAVASAAEHAPHVPVHRRGAFWAGLAGGAVVLAGGAIALGFLLRSPPLPSDTLGTVDGR